VIGADPETGTLVGAASCNVKLLVMVSAVVACFDGSAKLCVVRLTVGEFGKICGAVKFPCASTMPHSDGHAEPDNRHVTVVSGRPLLVTDAWKSVVAPSSTPAFGAGKVICKSLVIATVAFADFVASAWLTTLTRTEALAGRSAGAV
jgi:hypothetical protein